MVTAGAAEPSALALPVAGRYARPVIVVVGDPMLHPFDGHAPAVAGGPAAAIARACVLAGATVQLAGRIGDDPAGDEILLSLTRDGIGHVALLRNAGLSTAIGSAAADTPVSAVSADDAWTREASDVSDDGAQPAEEVDPPVVAWPSAPSSLPAEDLDLALRYLVTFSVLVVAEPLGAATLAVAAESAAFSGAHLVIVGRPLDVPAAAAETVTVLEPPLTDPDGEFAAVVARYAVALDGGTQPAEAFRSALGSSGWEPATT